MRYLILSKSHSQGIAKWWLPAGQGYTMDIDRAGRWSAEESARIVAGSPEKDLRVPESAIGRTVMTTRVVDLSLGGNRGELMAFDGA